MASADPNTPPPAYSEEPPSAAVGATSHTPAPEKSTETEGAATSHTPAPETQGAAQSPKTPKGPFETKDSPSPYPVQQHAPVAAAQPTVYPVQPGADYIQFVPFGQPMAPSDYKVQQSEGFVIADFYPRCLTPGRKAIDQLPKFEPFSTIVRQANQWLMWNPAHRVMHCESVEVDAEYTGKIHADSCVLMESGNAINLYVRGLRVWCRIDHSQDQKPPHQLWYVNVVPFCRHAGQSLGAALNGHGASFDGLNETIQRLNAQLASSPLPGTVVTVEQVELKLTASTNLGAFNLDDSCWGSDPKKGRFFLKCIRVFYVMEPGAVAEQVGVAVIAPTGTMKALSFSKWSSFNAVMSSTANFMLANPNICVKNIQTVEYPKHCPSFKEGPSRQLSVAVDPTFNVFGLETTSVFGMWIGYTVKTTPTPSFPSGQVTCRTFTPYKIGKRTYESVPACLNRISTWIRLTKNRLVSAETCTIYHNPEYKVIHDETMSRNPSQGALQHRITMFRLYFDGPVVEPPPHMLPKPEQLKSNVCNIM